MPERFARFAAFALLGILVLIFPLLVALVDALTMPLRTRTPTTAPALLARTSPTRPAPSAMHTNTATAGTAVSAFIAEVSPSGTVSPPRDASPTRLHVPASESSHRRSVTPSLTATAGCPSPATPEPLWVNPVVSPTTALTQKISLILGRGREIVITSEAGTVTRKGAFSIAQAVEIEIPLLPDTTHHLVVSGQVEYAPGCFYTLQTRTDRMGAPLIIVQSAAPSSLPLKEARADEKRVYIKPFSQVFAVGQNTPRPAGAVWLYQGGGDPFLVVAEEGVYIRVQMQKGTLNFWTPRLNLVEVPPPPLQLDESVRGREAQLLGNAVFGCEDRLGLSSPAPHITAADASATLGLCTQLWEVSRVALWARVVSETSVLYLVSRNGTRYWISGNALTVLP